MKVNVTFRRVFSVDCTAEHVADNWLLYAFTLHKFLVPKNTIVPGNSKSVDARWQSGIASSQRNEKLSFGDVGLDCCSSDDMRERGGYD